MTAYADLFDTTVEYPIPTKRGLAVLTLRPLNADNLAFVAEMLERERVKAAAEMLERERVKAAEGKTDDEAPGAVVESADSPAITPDEAPGAVVESADSPAITPESITATRGKEAADIHRWCFESATIAGEPVVDGLAFLTSIAVGAQTKFRALVAFLTAGEKKEAAPETLAGESQAG